MSEYVYTKEMLKKKSEEQNKFKSNKVKELKNIKEYIDKSLESSIEFAIKKCHNYADICMFTYTSKRMVVPRRMAYLNDELQKYKVTMGDVVTYLKSICDLDISEVELEELDSFWGKDMTKYFTLRVSW